MLQFYLLELMFNPGLCAVKERVFGVVVLDVAASSYEVLVVLPPGHHWINFVVSLVVRDFIQ